MKSAIQISKGERVFSIFNYCFFAVLMITMVYPLWHILCASFSDANAITAHSGLVLKPLDFTFEAYKYMSHNPMILKGYFNTIFIVVAGVFLNIAATSVTAYFLSRKNVMYRNAIMIMIVFTMYFSGGLIPFYFTVKDLGLENSYWALIIPTAVNTYNMIIMRTAFAAIPPSLEESAKLDGAGHVRILISIIMPTSKAIVAVMVLYYAVDHWNAWFNAMLFLNDRHLYPLQLILREILIQNDTSSMTQNIMGAEQMHIGETIKYAVIVVATAPILCIYPFVQKYFVKGVMIGAVKE